MDWIKVEDKLPKSEKENDSIPCLVYTKGVVVIRVYNMYHKCWDDEDGDDHYTEAVGGRVSHWKPLPEGPKIN